LRKFLKKPAYLLFVHRHGLPLAPPPRLDGLEVGMKRALASLCNHRVEVLEATFPTCEVGFEGFLQGVEIFIRQRL
jgi:hypothetical protein